MEGSVGEVKNFNPNKRIADELVLDILLKHRNAVYKAHFGRKPSDEQVEKQILTDNQRILNQVAAIRDVISSQEMMIDIVARPTIEENCLARWRKKYKTEKEQRENPFEKEDNDLTELMEWREFLGLCMGALKKADLTPSLDDDFKITKTNPKGEEEHHLTKNFYEIRTDLAESYNSIYRLMIRNKIVTSGLEEDEELTYKEQEELFIERFREA